MVTHLEYSRLMLHFHSQKSQKHVVTSFYQICKSQTVSKCQIKNRILAKPIRKYFGQILPQRLYYHLFGKLGFQLCFVSYFAKLVAQVKLPIDPLSVYLEKVLFTHPRKGLWYSQLPILVG
jgi:hypothetical protein